MKINYKKTIIITAALCLAIFFVFLIFNNRTNLILSAKNKNAIMIDSIDQRLSYVFSRINDFPGSAADDLLFMSSLSCLNSQVNSLDINNYTNCCDLYSDFNNFIRQNQAYSSLKILDLEGNELIKAHRTKEGAIINGENISVELSSDYFQKVEQLTKGEVYISPILIKDEDDIQETGPRLVHTPVMRYATPVFFGGEKKAILVSDIDANYFLEDIRRSTREGEDVFMIDMTGRYLASKDVEQEFSSHHNFFNDYPEIEKDQLKDYRFKNKVTNSRIFSFKHIEPVKSNFAIYQASEHLLSESEEMRRHWLLVSVTNQEGRVLSSSPFQDTYLWLVPFCGLIILFTIFLFLINLKK